MCLRDMCLLYREIRYDTKAAVHMWRIFYFSPERQKGDSVELIIIKQVNTRSRLCSNCIARQGSTCVLWRSKNFSLSPFPRLPLDCLRSCHSENDYSKADPKGEARPVFGSRVSNPAIKADFIHCCLAREIRLLYPPLLHASLNKHQVHRMSEWGKRL